MALSQEVQCAEDTVESAPDDLADLRRRIDLLEKLVERLAGQQRVDRADPTAPWWKTDTGTFAGDELFDQIIQLGRRRSFRPS